MSLKLGLRNKIRRSRAGGAVPILLDQSFASGATAAYSLRQLKSSATKAVRVREDSGNTETDIGFSGTLLDETALLNHCGSANGFVTKWYDQSVNNNDASNSTATEQPQIVSSGSVIQEKGKPALDFDGSDDFLKATSSSELNNIYDNGGAVIVVFSNNNNSVPGDRLYGKSGSFSPSGNEHSLLSSNSNTGVRFEYHFSGNRLLCEFDNMTVIQHNRLIFTYNALDTSDRPGGYNNGTALTITTSDAPSGTRRDDSGKDLFIGKHDVGDFFSGKIQEFVYISDDKTGKTKDISDNLENFYK